MLLADDEEAVLFAIRAPNGDVFLLVLFGRFQDVLFGECGGGGGRGSAAHCVHIQEEKSREKFPISLAISPRNFIDFFLVL